MKTSYKWNVVSNSKKDQLQSIYVNKKTKEQISNSEQTLGIGITTVIFYFFTFLYIYGSAIINKEHINLDNFGKKLTNGIRTGEILNLNTLSGSFQNCERIGTIIFIITFLALLQGLFAFQNINTNDIKRAPIIVFNYVIILCWLLFMFIFPSHKNGKTSMSHLFLAFCVLASVVINCFLIGDLYTQYFDGIESLVGINYALITFALFAGLIMMINGGIGGLARSAVAYSEMACLVLFGIFMIFFILLPPLPSGQLACVITENK